MDNDLERTVVVGTRVYYRPDGVEDTGTIVDITLHDFPFVVQWDKPGKDQIDSYMGSQLGFAEEKL